MVKLVGTSKPLLAGVITYVKMQQQNTAAIQTVAEHCQSVHYEVSDSEELKLQNTDLRTNNAELSLPHEW